MSGLTDEQSASLAALIHAAHLLRLLNEGPRDDYYEGGSPAAWESLAMALDDVKASGAHAEVGA